MSDNNWTVERATEAFARKPTPTPTPAAQRDGAQTWESTDAYDRAWLKAAQQIVNATAGEAAREGMERGIREAVNAAAREAGRAALAGAAFRVYDDADRLLAEGGIDRDLDVEAAIQHSGRAARVNIEKEGTVLLAADADAVFDTPKFDTLDLERGGRLTFTFTIADDDTPEIDLFDLDVPLPRVTISLEAI
jgi:hypothetical protein